MAYLPLVCGDPLPPWVPQNPLIFCTKNLTIIPLWFLRL